VDVPSVVGGLDGEARQVGAIADLQHGVLNVTQLAQLGLDPSTLKRRCAAGSLVRIHRGVYSADRRTLTTEGHWLAAVLATQPHSLLAGRSALACWEALPHETSPAHVVSPRRLRTPGIATQEASLHPDDCCALDLIPLTSPARSLLDFAAGGDPAELERALNELRIARLVRPQDFEELRSRTFGHHGWRDLGRLLAAETEPGFSREELERRMIRLIREAALPSPHRNARVGRWEVDFLFPEHRLVVETDGYAVHPGRRAFERDREKQAELQDLGFEVLRFTWWQITERPLWVTARLASRLGARAPAA